MTYETYEQGRKLILAEDAGWADFVKRAVAEDDGLNQALVAKDVTEAKDIRAREELWLRVAYSSLTANRSTLDRFSMQLSVVWHVAAQIGGVLFLLYMMTGGAR